MHLGEVIKRYRTEHEISQADFAKISGISKGYISMLENNKNPATGEPLAPTYTIFEKVASVLSCSTDALLRSMDDNQMITLNKEQPAPAADSEFNKELLFSWIDSMSREELIETLQVVTNKLSEK